MSTIESHGHSHDEHHHEHGHFGTIGAVLVILAGLEVRLGFTTHNSSIASLGSHTLVDALFPLVSALVAKISATAVRRGSAGSQFPRLSHWIGCQLRVYTALLLGLANIVLIGLLPLVFAPASLSSRAALAGVGIGSVDLLTKLWVLRRLSRAARLPITWRLLLRTPQAATSQAAVILEHFRLDAEAALATITSSALTATSGNLKWIIAAVGYILARSVYETVPQLNQLNLELHRVWEHPSPSTQV